MQNKTIEIIENEKRPFKELEQGDIFYMADPKSPRIKLNPNNDNTEGNAVGLIDGVCYSMCDDTIVSVYIKFEFKGQI